MANPFPFVASTVLQAAQLNGIGEVTSFTPTWFGLTVGNATQSFKYVRVNNFVFVQGKFTLGSTSSINGTTYMSAPITPANQASNTNVGDAWIVDSGVGSLYGQVIFESGVFVIRAINTSGTYAFPTEFAPTVPFTWNTNDSFGVNFMYQI
jgi:hypothetical protein